MAIACSSTLTRSRFRSRRILPPERVRDPFADPRTVHGVHKNSARQEEHTGNFGTDDLDDSDEFAELEDVAAVNATHSQADEKSAFQTPDVALQRRGSFATSNKDATRTVSPKIPLEAARVPAAHATPKSVSGNDLQALLAAAGIEGLQPTSETAQVLGEVLRTMVGGLMEVLRARERIKDELRMRGTTFKASNNNPLKFSANVDDAFHNLLVKHNPAYLPPTEAFDDALKDLRDHQTASLIAMRLAFEAMLARFDPSRLQEEFDRHLKKGSILGVPAKLRYWDLFRERYGDMVKDADAGFRNLFGEEFARAYEEQLARLRVQGRG